MLKNLFENAEIHCIKSFGFINAPVIGTIMLHQNVDCCMCVIVYGWMNNLIMMPIYKVNSRATPDFQLSWISLGR